MPFQISAEQLLDLTVETTTSGRVEVHPMRLGKLLYILNFPQILLSLVLRVMINGED